MLKHSTKKVEIGRIISFINEKHPGGKLLSDVYINAGSKLSVQCENGHVWNVTWNSLYRGIWCPHCFKERCHYSISEVKQFVKEKHNGECLSNELGKCRSKLKFKCSKNHLWEATLNSIMTGKWCPYCNKPQKHTVADVKRLINGRGILLSKEYKCNFAKIEIKCNCGNIFKINFHSLRKGSWCPCSKKHMKQTIEYIKKFVKEKYNAECLEEEYVDCETLMKFKCNRGHERYMPWSGVRSGKWCAECYGNIKLTLDKINDFVYDHYFGKCISEKYKNNREPLKFECAVGHQWETNWKNISTGCWCPKCSEGFGESISRTIFEQMFGYKFVKIRPEWLINDKTGRKLELDGYCAELNIAFEYQGRQHFEFVKEFKSTDATLQSQIDRDNLKINRCKELGITLIHIPEYSKKFRPENLVEFILNRIDKTKYIINENVVINKFWERLKS